MKELTESIGFFHDVLWPDPDEHPGRPMAVIKKIGAIEDDEPDFGPG
jgi:hypothetical protein